MSLKNRTRRHFSTIVVNSENNISEETLIKVEAARIAGDMLGRRLTSAHTSLSTTDVIDKYFEQLYDVVLKQIKK